MNSARQSDNNAAETSLLDASRESTSTKSAAASLQSVASRFRERAMQLDREKQLLQQTEEVLQSLIETEECQKAKHAKHRVEFLSVRQRCDVLEKEVLVQQERASILREENQELDKEINLIKQESEKEKDEQQSKIEDSLITPYRTRRTLYLEYLRERVNAVEQTEKIREQKRRKLEEIIEILRATCDKVEQQQTAFRQEAKEQHDAVIRDTEESRVLAEKVRAALAERQQLRDDLRRAKSDAA